MKLSNYKNVFCDSKKALNWAYKHGLPTDATIKTSSPALLFEKNPNIVHVESKWSVDEMKQFQTSIEVFSENIYNSLKLIDEISHEESLCITQSSVLFHKIIYKAACLTEKDIKDPRLHIKVDGNGGPNGNNMNAPWDLLLSSFHAFDTIIFTQHSDWSVLTTSGVPLWKKLFVGGVETLVYRVYTNFLSKFFNSFFTRNVIIPNENELVIETAYNLLIKGVGIGKISNNCVQVENLKNDKYNNKAKVKLVEKTVLPIITKRLNEWVIPSLVPICVDIYKDSIKTRLEEYWINKERWRVVFKKENFNKKVLLTNAPANVNLMPLTELCRENNIPVISAQHGVTKEICAMLGEAKQMYEINYSDKHFAYNVRSAIASEQVTYSRGSSFVVGMSRRHHRMYSRLGNKGMIVAKRPPSIVYISTNLYRGNLGLLGTWMTDYGLAIIERDMILKVLTKIPHRVRYKTYPEDNRRYADIDPIFNIVKKSNNIELYENKVDMRYLLNKHQIIITSGATSTLGWPIMSGKPVVFINRKNKMSLTDDAHKAFSKSLFLFDDCSDSFFDDLLNFLSQSIDDIYKQWAAKEKARNIMIEEYFSKRSVNAGKLAAEVIIEEYLQCD
jgi:hypothetical protein